MAFDYKENYEYAEFWRKEILPYLRHLTDGAVSFGEYLAGFYRNQKITKTFGAPLPYVYSLEWIKRYQDKCVTFHYNNPEEVAKGAALMSVIYQITPSIHASSNLQIWRDDNENDGHVTNFVIYEKLDDLLQFMADNVDIVKKPKEKKVGFALNQVQNAVENAV